uniref:Zinc/iron permease n=1 Tax=Chrysotila carterae TaxID=13221 RepID=A0A7S4F992_CHRCT|mmetsp:Transcript_47270/g.102642  ORF Transcript_47270/g.102642 Transcript_47270/m.102642 type:complete len:399 (-) Transcript_47270:586-1782(-)
MEKLTFDAAALGVILIMSMLGISMPLYLRGSFWNGQVIDAMGFFTGGVFLGAGMMHMLPDAVEMFEGLKVEPVLLHALCSPYAAFAYGWLLVWAIESNQPDKEKHAVLAVAQSARLRGTSADICFVTVPHVTTYHKAKEVISGVDSSRLVDVKRSDSLARSSHQTFRHEDSRRSGLNPTECQPCGSDDHGEDGLPLSGPQHFHAELKDVQPFLEIAARRKWCTGPDCPSAREEHVHEGVKHKHLTVAGTKSVLPLLLALLFSAHSLIAGLALGIKAKLDSSAVAILVAILGHKLVEAVSLASSFVKEDVVVKTALPVLLVYTLMTPAGIVLGAFLSNIFTGKHVILVESAVGGFAAGSFIFLASHEMGHASSSALSTVTQALLALCGVLLMGSLSVWT